jgi:polysaccharide export outer membrane protein
MNNRGSYIKEIVAVLCLSIAAGTIGLQASQVQHASAGAKPEAGTAKAKAMPPVNNADPSLSPVKPSAVRPAFAFPPADNADPSLGSGKPVAVQLAMPPADNSNLSKEIPVSPDGKISLPIIGDIQASGHKASELQERIQQRPEVFVSHPQVNVTVKEIESRSFNIIGKVSTSGVYDLKKATTVLDAIAEAGGFQHSARVTKIYILRYLPNGDRLVFPFNYKDALRGDALNQKVELIPGDTVVVP